MSQNVSVVVLALSPSGKGQVLGTQKQYVLTAEMLDRRALPHIAERLESRHLEFALKHPAMLKVFGGVDENASPLVLCLRSDDHIILVFAGNADNLGIALMLGVIGIGTEKRQWIFFRPAVVAQTGQAGVGMAGPVGIAVISCIIQINLIPDRHGGTGIDALVVIAVLLIGQEADAEILPCDQIFGNNVIPVLEAMDCTPGAPLIEKMPAIVVPDKSVRVVHQAGHCLIVKVLPVH